MTNTPHRPETRRKSYSWTRQQPRVFAPVDGNSIEHQRMVAALNPCLTLETIHAVPTPRCLRNNFPAPQQDRNAVGGLCECVACDGERARLHRLRPPLVASEPKGGSGRRYISSEVGDGRTVIVDGYKGWVGKYAGAWIQREGDTQPLWRLVNTDDNCGNEPLEVAARKSAVEAELARLLLLDARVAKAKEAQAQGAAGAVPFTVPRGWACVRESHWVVWSPGGDGDSYPFIETVGEKYSGVRGRKTLSVFASPYAAMLYALGENVRDEDARGFWIGNARFDNANPQCAIEAIERITAERKRA